MAGAVKEKSHAEITDLHSGSLTDCCSYIRLCSPLPMC